MNRRESDDETAAYEARLRAVWLARRARVGLLLLCGGMVGLVMIPILLASSDIGGDALVQVFPGVFVAIGAGAWTLRVGMPGDPVGGPVPRAILVRTVLWILPVAMLVIAWPIGVYRAIAHAAALAGTPCETLLPIRQIERLGVRPRPISRAERSGERCLVELAATPGTFDVASLQLIVEAARREDVARVARRGGRRTEPLPSLGPDAWRVRYDAGQRIVVFRGGRSITVQLARSAWSDEASERLVAHLANALAD